MANYSAKIDVILSGLRELSLLEDRLEKIGGIINTLNKTPVALNVGGRGQERDLSGKLSKEVNDYVREWVNGNKNIGKSINAVQQQAAAFQQLLRETAMVQQDPAAKNAVANLATAWADTTRAAAQYERKLNDIERKALGLQPQDVRDLEVARRQNFVRDERRRRERAAFLAGAPVSQFPIGPNLPSTRRRFEGDTSVERAEAALRAKELQNQRTLNAKLFTEEKAQVLELDRLRAASAQRQTQRIQALGKAVRGSLSSAVIGGAFPLLFGQSPEAAVGGALGGLFGGAAGGFAGSLLGTALGEIAASKKRIQELSLELGFSATQAKELSTAFELAGRNSEQLQAAITNIQGLGLSVQETASAIKISNELAKEYGGSIEKIAQAFADTFESGKVTIATLNKFVAQGIPIQDALAAKLGVTKSKLLEMTKDGQVSVQQLTDVLVSMGVEAEKTADKGKSGFDQFAEAVKRLATAVSDAAGAVLKNLVPALDTVLTRLASIIERATQAINLISDAQVGEASAALFRSGAARGIFGGFAQSKGVVDDLTQGLKTLNPALATNKEQLEKIATVASRYRTELQNFGGQVGEYATTTAQVELSRVQQGIALRARQLNVGAPTAAAGITPINAPSQLAPSGGGGGAGPKPPEDRTAQLREEFAAIVAIGQAEDKIRDLLFQGREILAAELELEKELADIERDRNKALIGSNYESERMVINKIAEARAVDAQLKNEDKIREIRQKRFEQELQTQEAVRNSIQSFVDVRQQQDLQLQYSKTYARLVTEGMLPAEAERVANYEKLVIEQTKGVELQIKTTQAAILEAAARGLSVTKLQEQLDLLTKQRDAIAAQAALGPGAAQTESERMVNALAAMQGEFNLLIASTNQLTAAATSVGDAFANSFKGIISGSMTAQESLAGFFQSVADYFLDMAGQIIKKWIEMTILNNVLKLFPGGGGFAPLSGAQATGFNFDVDAMSKGPVFGGFFANGGSVSGGTAYVVGERGPELFVPGRSGTIIPNERMGGVGGTTNVVVNVDAKGSSVQGDDGRANELGRVVSAAVQSEIIKQQRPGGLLAGTR